MRQRKLDVYNTHMTLSPYKHDDIPELELMYTSVDAFSQEDVPCGYSIRKDTLYLPRGTPVEFVEKLAHPKTTFHRKSDPAADMHIRHYPTSEPRDHLQERSIDFLSQPDRQLSINVVTGGGKTFIAAYASVKLNKRTIIITPSEELKMQWIKTYTEMMDMGSDDILDITSSDTMKAILDREIDIDHVDVFFVNHQTLRSFVSRYGIEQLTAFFNIIKVGIKVYDEAHKEFYNILLIDSFTNTERTWYLTATFDRSDKYESKCFRQAFSSVIQYGEEESRKVTPPHVIYHTVNINSQISPANRKKVFGWRGMTSASYGEYAYHNDPKDTATKTIVDLVRKAKKVEGKILVLVPLIDAVEKVADVLLEEFPDLTVSKFHSRVPKDEKADAFNCDVIVSTLKSCGTGKDIKGLRTVISGEPVASKINAEQMIGRLRPYKNKEGKQLDTYFFDIVDTCIAPVMWWWRSRFKKIKNIVKKTVVLSR